jgi:hypothetical protein
VKPSEKTAFDLVSGDNLVKGDNAADILKSFVRETNPFEHFPLSSVFDYAVEFFLPAGVNIDKLDREVQKNIIMEIIAKDPERDKQLEFFMKQMEELTAAQENADKNLNASQTAFQKFQSDTERIKAAEQSRQAAADQKKKDLAEKRKKGGLVTENDYLSASLGIAENVGDTHEINEVKFTFTVKETKLPDGTVQSVLSWSVQDRVLQTADMGSIKIAPAEIGNEKMRIMDGYLSNRMTRVAQKQSQLSQNIKAQGGAMGKILQSQGETEDGKKTYEAFKKMMSDTAGYAKQNKLDAIRGNLRKQLSRDDMQR